MTFVSHGPAIDFKEVRPLNKSKICRKALHTDPITDPITDPMGSTCSSAATINSETERYEKVEAMNKATGKMQEQLKESRLNHVNVHPVSSKPPVDTEYKGNKSESSLAKAQTKYILRSSLSDPLVRNYGGGSVRGSRTTDKRRQTRKTELSVTIPFEVKLEVLKGI